MSGALIVRNDAALSISFTEEAERQKCEALELSGVIGKVTNATENASAFEAQKKLTEIISLVEKARRQCKEPVLEYGHRIDAAAKKFVGELKEEDLRIAQLMGDFAAVELARTRAAERLRNEELSKIERERAEALSKAKTIEAQDAVTEHFDNKARDVAPPPQTTRAEGQVLRNDWEITVTDIHVLYRFHPNCVKLEPLIGEIKNLLKMGAEIKGVAAKPIVKPGVRRSKEREAIEV